MQAYFDFVDGDGGDLALCSNKAVWDYMAQFVPWSCLGQGRSQRQSGHPWGCATTHYFRLLNGGKNHDAAKELISAVVALVMRWVTRWESLPLGEYA